VSIPYSGNNPNKIILKFPSHPHTAHNWILEMSSGTRSPSKRSMSIISEQRTKELYDPFNDNQIMAQELLP